MRNLIEMMERKMILKGKHQFAGTWVGDAMRRR